MANTWHIEEDLWWHSPTQSIHFAVTNGSERHVCAISQIALNDYYKTEDSKEVAFDNFEKDRQKIIGIATEIFTTYKPNEDNIYFIKSSNMR